MLKYPMANQGKTLTELATIYEKKKTKPYKPKLEPWNLPKSKEDEENWGEPIPPQMVSGRAENLTRRNSFFPEC